ncbi:hypothetical protein [Serratia marcescens]|uniref:hypothetical protein n=1 Tax=Serratia marcescens TaxID=615 RepID=UPI0028FEF526|nr:hypothetical protein [Serratia marcescens]MDU1396738.1 hypothetical protein [Serratia marcescens]
MDNKLSELSKPVATVDVQRGRMDGHTFAVAWSSAGHALPDGPHFIYSQEYVSALKHESAVNWEAAASLNVENQELKKRITELESANKSQDDHINQQQDRIDSLEKTNAGLGRRLGDAEKRLATPVRLPPPTAWMRGDDKTTFGPIFTKNKDYAESQWGDSAIALYSVPVGIKEAGFSDERNLMHINERGRETSLIWSKNNSENGDIQLFRLVGFTVEGG